MPNKYTIIREKDFNENQPILRADDLDSQFDLIYKYLDSLDISSEFIYKIIESRCINSPSGSDYIFSTGDGKLRYQKKIYDSDSVNVYSNNVIKKNIPKRSVFYSFNGELKSLTGRGYLRCNKVGDDVSFYFKENIEDYSTTKIIYDFGKYAPNSIKSCHFSKDQLEKLSDVILDKSKIIINAPTLFRFANECFSGLNFFDYFYFEAKENSEDWADKQIDMNKMFGPNVRIFENINEDPNFGKRSIRVDAQVGSAIGKYKDFFNNCFRTEYSSVIKRHVITFAVPVDINYFIDDYTKIKKINFDYTLTAADIDVNGFDPIFLTRLSKRDHGKEFMEIPYVYISDISSDHMFGDGSIDVDHLSFDLRKKLDF